MRDFGGRRVRAKLVAVLVVLVALWSYAAYVTSRDALDLLQVRALGETLGQPTDLLILGLQAERRLTVTALDDAASARPALVAQRDRTDEAVRALRAFLRDGDLRLASADALRDQARELVRRLDAIGPLRQDVDAGRLDQDRAADAYDGLIDSGFGVYAAQWTSRESALVEGTREMVALARAREVLAREDTLVGGVLGTARVTAAQQRRIVELVANQRFARAEAAAGLTASVRADYQRLAAGPSFAGLAAIESRLLQQNLAGGPPAVTAQAWQTAVVPALAGLRDLVTHGIRDTVERATPGAVGVVVRTGLVVGLGLVAILAVIVGSVSTTRRLAGRLGQLRATAERLGDQDLPDVVKRLRRGEPVEAPPEAPPLPAGANQLDRLEHAIEAARAATIRAVLAEAESHKGTWDLFLQLTRRNQSLLRDQLSLLDAMERRERDNAELADLFRVDHLATRIRRNVEKLITMAGATPARRWRRPVPLLDVVRGAVAEVLDYPRVLVAPNWPGALAGPVVPDVIHLLAELIENGLACSPESSTVRVAGEPREGGCAIIVTDDGPGMSGPALAAANELLRNPPLHRPPGTGHGLYAVGLIARRRGVEVELRASPRGGTAAVVVLPAGRLVGVGGAGRTAAGANGAAPGRDRGKNGTAPGGRDVRAGRAAETAEFPYLTAGVTGGDTSGSVSAARDTPGGLPVRARQPGPPAAPPPAGPAAVPGHADARGPAEAPAPIRPAEPVTARQAVDRTGVPEPDEGVDAPRAAGRAGRQVRQSLSRSRAGESGTLPVRAPMGPPGSDGSETMEMPIARPVGEEPESNRPTARPQTVGHGPSTQPTRIGGGFNGSERTTSGSADGHDR